TIALAAVGVNRANQDAERAILLGAGTRPSLPTRVVAGPRDRENPTHHHDRKHPLVLPDAGVPHGDGLAKYAVAFFRKSRSCRRISTSRRRRRSSARSVGVSCSRSPVPYFCRHRHSACSLTFNSAATSRNGRPVSSRNRTASRLYCSSNFRRAFPMGHPLGRIYAIGCPRNRGRLRGGPSTVFCRPLPPSTRSDTESPPRSPGNCPPCPPAAS